ncbi:DUF2628 domain-containing protein [Maridesulfovibrio sp. FT414]|uniref:DUF2628 domain-containing protein n=1 Tax=Maridesulfovibrio sp. FT414 TaxID=2979469 RepID=UPI003D8068AB
MDSVIVSKGRMFIGPEYYYYRSMFRQFAANHGRFRSTWNWCAFFFGPVWFLYRKMYVWAMVSLAAGVIPYLAIPLMIGCGLAGNYLYYRDFLEKSEKVEDSYSPDIQDKMLALAGGVHPWAKLAGIVPVALFYSLLFLSVVVPMCLPLLRN